MFRVTADIRYLDGTLQGVTVPAGFVATVPSRERALKIARLLKCVMQANDFIRATSTGNRYAIEGGIDVSGVS